MDNRLDTNSSRCSPPSLLCVLVLPPTQAPGSAFVLVVVGAAPESRNTAPTDASSSSFFSNLLIVLEEPRGDDPSCSSSARPPSGAGRRTVCRAAVPGRGEAVALVVLHDAHHRTTHAYRATGASPSLPSPLLGGKHCAPPSPHTRAARPPQRNEIARAGATVPQLS